MNRKFLTSKNIFVACVVVCVLFAGYYFYDNSNPVRAELSAIQKISQAYKNENGNFGIIADVNDLKNCFAGNTFVKVQAMNVILTSPEVENISCVFQTATSSPVVENWSITIVKGDKAYCEDSSGDTRETPGLTTSHLCNISN